jgi:dTDP-glucose pyrophosphorylase
MSADAKSTMIITMAGRGSRFRLAGYDVPKYRIVVRGRSLFSWSMSSLSSFARERAQFVFVYLHEDDPREFIHEECGTLGIERFSFIALDQVTDGQATTALAAAAAIEEPSRPVAIYNIDTYVEPQHLSPQAVRGAGWIPCFPGEGSGWSFALTDNNQRVVEIREKQRISPHATVGFYWFDSFHRYSDAYNRY